MSIQEAAAAIAELIEENLSAVHVEVFEDGQPLIQVPLGTGKSNVFLRLVLESHAPLAESMTRTIAELATADWAAAVRNALVHEGQIQALMTRANLGIEVDAFVELLSKVLEGVGPAIPVDAGAQFTEAELAELTSEGVKVVDKPSAGGAAARTAAEYAALLANSMSVQEASNLLSVDESRIRQRLTDRTLYGIKTGRSWRLPGFQFDDNGAIKGLDEVLPVLPTSLHPVAIHRWMTTPIADLELDSEALSPLMWLSATGDAQPVIDLARDL